MISYLDSIGKETVTEFDSEKQSADELSIEINLSKSESSSLGSYHSSGSGYLVLAGRVKKVTNGSLACLQRREI